MQGLHNPHITPDPHRHMNPKEGEIANALLEEIRDAMRTDQPEKARTISDTYKNLCAAYEIRVRADNMNPNK